MGPDSHSCAFFLPLLTVPSARPQRKLHYNLTPSGSKGRQIQALPTSSQPLVLQGMQVTCGLPDLMMSFHHQTEKKHRQPAAFLPSSTTIDRSIDRSSRPPIEYAWASNFNLQVVLGLQRSLKSCLSQHIIFWLHFKPCKWQTYPVMALENKGFFYGLEWTSA